MLTSQCFLEYCTTIIKVHNDVTKISTDPKLPLQSSENIKLNIALRMYSFEECSLNNKSLGIASGLPGWHSSKESTCQCRRCRRYGFDPWVRKIPWSKKWQHTPVFLLGNPMDRGARQATICGVTKSQTPLSAWACTKAVGARLLLLEKRCYECRKGEG